LFYFVEKEINLAFGEGNTPNIMNFIIVINNKISFFKRENSTKFIGLILVVFGAFYGQIQLIFIE
jgi:sulfite exporter TauE/SafE